MTRREFVTAASALGVTSLPNAWPSAAESGNLNAPPPYDGNQKTDRYILLGNRMVFTNWFFVRPGRLDWLDKNGKSVFSSKQAVGPWGAQFKGTDFPHGVRIAAKAATRIGPIIHPQEPWEQIGIGLETIIQEGNQFRAWAVCSRAAKESIPAYFESQDGLNWRRPNLGLRDWEGSRANNLLSAGFTGEASIFIDPVSPPEERYKWVSHSHYRPNVFEAWHRLNPGPYDPMIQDNDNPNVYHGVQGAVSPDGLHWTILPDTLVFEPTDTQLVCYYDLRRRKYVIYTRGYMGAGSSSRRAVARAESEDFRKFPVSRVVLETSPDMGPCHTLYTNCRTTIPGAPDHHLLFPSIYELTVDSTQIGFASSHDGEIWSFVPGSPVAAPGTFGEWDGGVLFAHPNLIELADGRFALPYTGNNFPHKYPRGEVTGWTGYLTWPKGRLVAIETLDIGEFSTVGFLAPGRKVLINAVTERAGGIMVEAATDSDGNTIPGRSFADCKPIIGDCYKIAVTWNGQDDLGYKEGEPIILRFRMKNAQIFGLEFV